MNRKILFVCEGKNFLVSSMIKSLEDAQFEVLQVQPMQQSQLPIVVCVAMAQVRKLRRWL